MSYGDHHFELYHNYVAPGESESEVLARMLPTFCQERVVFAQERGEIECWLRGPCTIDEHGLVWAEEAWIFVAFRDAATAVEYRLMFSDPKIDPYPDYDYDP